MNYRLWVPLAVVLSCILHSALAAQPLQLGIVADYDDNADLREFCDSIRVEIQKTVGSSAEIELQRNNILASAWDLPTAANNYRALTQRCDIILLIGALAVKSALDQGAFTKPTIALGVFDNDLQNVPITATGTSGVRNFSYVLTTQDIDHELEYFQSLVDYSNLAILFDGRTTAAFDDTKGRRHLDSLQKQLNANIHLMSVENDIAASLQKLPAGTDAVYLTIPYERNHEDIRKLADVLIEKKLPSFSSSRWHVELGILACLSDNNDVNQILKKIAIMTDDVIRGEPLANMRVNLNHKDEPYLNIVTAEQIGYSPTFETLFTANIVGDKSQRNLPTYTIDAIIKRAIEENLDIRVSGKDLELTEKDLSEAKSQILPDIAVSATLTQIDESRVSAAAGSAASSITGTGTLTQVIFSEEVFGSIAIQDYLMEAQRYTTKQQVLDVALQSFSAYFAILQAKTNTLIEEENLQNSKQNLELAKLKVTLGQSTNADIFRWESEVAVASQNVIEAQTALALAKLQLNTLLNNTLEREFEVADAGLGDAVFQAFQGSQIGQFVKGPAEFELIVDFLVQEALRNYPTKKQLAANLKATERKESMFGRLYYLPTLSASAEIDNVMWRGGSGSTAPDGVDITNTTWNASLILSYPLFNSNLRSINLQRAHIEKEQLNLQIRSLDQSLQLSVQQSAYDVFTAGTNLGYSKISAENTEKNFELVQDNYKKGLVSIIQLLDAQEAALQAKQGYSNAVYQYLLAFLTLENTIGYHNMLATPKEQAEFRDRLQTFISNQKP